MAQISRPYQIALAAMALLALVWFVALHGHAGGSSEPSVAVKPSPPVTQPKGAAQEREAAKSTHIYKGAAPGVEGLTRDIAKAHGAVATSQRNTAQLQRKAAQASGEAAGQKASTAASAGKGVAAKATVHRSTPTAPNHAPKGSVVRQATPNTPPRPAQQALVERELTHGKTVVLLFWNPKSTVDRTVRSQALSLAGASKGRVMVHVARASQVGLFGPVTEVAHVYQTPTILIVAHPGLVTTLTGLVDAFGLKQALREAEHAHK
jgi:hypothetical protein